MRDKPERVECSNAFQQNYKEPKFGNQMSQKAPEKISKLKARL